MHIFHVLSARNASRYIFHSFLVRIISELEEIDFINLSVRSEVLYSLTLTYNNLILLES